MQRFDAKICRQRFFKFTSQDWKQKYTTQNLRHSIGCKNMLQKINAIELDAKICYQKLTLLNWMQKYAAKNLRN